HIDGRSGQYQHACEDDEPRVADAKIDDCRKIQISKSSMGFHTRHGMQIGLCQAFSGIEGTVRRAFSAIKIRPSRLPADATALRFQCRRGKLVHAALTPDQHWPCGAPKWR